MSYASSGISNLTEQSPEEEAIGTMVEAASFLCDEVLAQEGGVRRLQEVLNELDDEKLRRLRAIVSHVKEVENQRIRHRSHV